MTKPSARTRNPNGAMSRRIRRLTRGRCRDTPSSVTVTARPANNPATENPTQYVQPTDPPPATTAVSRKRGHRLRAPPRGEVTRGMVSTMNNRQGSDTHADARAALCTGRPVTASSTRSSAPATESAMMPAYP